MLMMFKVGVALGISLVVVFIFEFVYFSGSQLGLPLTVRITVHS